MGIRINNNITALSSLRHLGMTHRRLTVSVERLSSGLRINRAADDPAGLTISEKLRAQIKGVQRASLNSQDGISMLQVAEGALSEVQAIIQRIRELSVQAANDTLTDNDRSQIQSEIGQLIDEVDRVASATEFNSRKLLDGSATGLWSADSSDIKAIMRGQPQEGNFIVEKRNTPGRAQVLKSDIFGLAGGASRGRATDILEVGPINNLTQADFTQFTNLEYTKLALGDPGNLNRDFQMEVLAPGAFAADQFTVTDHYFTQPGGKSGFAVALGGALAAGDSGYYELEVVEMDGDSLISAGGTDGVTLAVRRFGTDGELLGEGRLNSTEGAIAAGPIDFSSVGVANLQVQVAVDGDRLSSGDKWLFGVTAVADVPAGSYAMQLRQDVNDDGAFTPDAGLGSQTDTAEDRLSVVTAMSPALTGGSEFETTLAYYDSAGRSQFASGLVRMGLPGTTPTGPGTVDLNLYQSTLAERNTILKDVDRFVGEGGVSMVEVGMPLRVHANGKVAEIVIQGNDTLEGLAEKIRDAIITPEDAGGLGMSVDGNRRRHTLGVLEPAGVDGNTAVFVDDPLAGGDEPIEGTIVIRSPVPDQEGRITLSGDADLIRALSLATVQEPTDSLMEVSVRNAHTGVLVGNAVVSDGVVQNVIAGVDLVIDQSIDTDVTFDDARRVFDIASAAGSLTEHVHIVDTALRLQTGANEGQVLRASVGQVDSDSLGLDRLLVISQELAEEAIAIADRALSVVSTERAKLGAYLNRLEITQTILDIQAENLVGSESRIRDLDVAEQTIDFTRDQVLQQSGTAMLAQANALPQSVLQLLQ
ncbi:MAG: hypothetical protein GF320_18965 [Armatimonadia bacterium]|nr:hypothetical protein [Armatimonadia bacterium]